MHCNWRAASGCGALQVGVARCKWVWRASSGCGALRVVRCIVCMGTTKQPALGSAFCRGARRGISTSVSSTPSSTSLGSFRCHLQYSRSRNRMPAQHPASLFGTSTVRICCTCSAYRPYLRTFATQFATQRSAFRNGSRSSWCELRPRRPTLDRVLQAPHQAPHQAPQQAPHQAPHQAPQQAPQVQVLQITSKICAKQMTSGKTTSGKTTTNLRTKGWKKKKKKEKKKKKKERKPSPPPPSR